MPTWKWQERATGPYVIQCNSCRASGPLALTLKLKEGKLETAEEAAIKAWDRRVDDQSD